MAVTFTVTIVAKTQMRSEETKLQISLALNSVWKYLFLLLEENVFSNILSFFNATY